MFTVDKEAIGRHIAELIERNYKKARRFGIEYLSKRYPDWSEDEINAAIPNIQNRITQITKGNKWIQIEDLPYFAELLGVSVEDILSAGTSSPESAGRVTNYSIAHSADRAAWEAYLQREDKLFMNPDEYNKTVIDYALEAGNYPFLKYLMDTGHIWFVGEDKSAYFGGFGDEPVCFGAGTDVKKRDVTQTDSLNFWLTDKDDLRYKLMSLAVRNKDFDTLDGLHAREIPALYRIDFFSGLDPWGDKLRHSKNTEQFIKDLAACPKNSVLAYFFEPFTVKSTFQNRENTYIFPYAGKLLDQMVKQKSRNAANFIEMATKRNKEVLNSLNKAVAESIEDTRTFYKSFDFPESYIREVALRDLRFYPETGFIAFTSAHFSKKDRAKGLITNAVHMTVKSTDPVLQLLIDGLNETYETIAKTCEKKEK